MNLVITGTSAPAVAALTSVKGAATGALTPLQKFGAVSTGVFAAAAVGAGMYAAHSVKAFRDFDSAMTKSMAIMDDLSPRMRKRLEETAFTIARTTTFSAKEGAEAFYFLASAGYDAEESIKVLPPVAKFAQAGMFDLDKATQLLASSQAALGLRIKNDAVGNMKEMIRISDVLVKADAESNASVQEFATALTTKAAGAMRVMNVELEEGVAVLATFADRGVRGAKAGSNLAIVLRDIPRAAVRNQEEFKKFGIEIFDSSGNLKNLADVVDEFTTSLGPMNDGQRAATLEQLGMTRSVGDIIRVLIGGGDSIRNYEAILKQAGGTTERVASKQLTSFDAQLKLLRNEFDITAIHFGKPIAFWMASTLIPWVRETALPTLHSLGDWFISDLAPAFATIGTTVASVVLPPLEAFLWILQNVPGADKIFAWSLGIAMVAGTISFLSTHSALLAGALGLASEAIYSIYIGTLLWAGGASSLGGALAYVYTQSKLLHVLLFPFNAVFQGLSLAVATWGAVTVGVVAAIVVAVIALGYVIYRNWGTIKEWLMAFGSWLADTFGPIWDRIYAVVTSAVAAIGRAVWAMVRQIPGAVMAVVGGVWAILQGIGRGVVTVVQTIVAVAGSIASGAWSVIKAVAGAISSGMGVLMRVLAPVGRFFMSVFGAIWNWMSTTFGPGLAKIWKTISDELEKTGIEIGPTIDTLRAKFMFLFNIVRTVVMWVVKNAPHIGEAIGWVITHIGPGIVWLITNIGKALAWLGGGLVKFVSSIAGTVGRFLVQLGSDVWDGIKKIGSGLAAVFGPVLRFLAPIGRAFVTLGGIIVDMASKTAPFWVGAWHLMQKAAGFMVETMKNNIGPALLFIWRIIRSVADFVRTVFVAVWPLVQTTVQFVWDQIVNTIVTAVKIIGGIIRLVLNIIQGDVGGVFGAIWDIIVAVWSGILSFMQTTGQAILAVMGVAWNMLKAVVMLAVRVIGSTVLLLWDILGPVFMAIGSAIRTVLIVAFHLFMNAVKIVWDVVSTVISFAWNNVIKPVWNAIVWAVQNVLIPIFQALWTFLKGAWEGMGLLISDIWHGVIKPVWDAIMWTIQTVLIPVFQTLWSFIQTAWAAIGEIISFAWNTVIKPVWSAIYDAISLVLVPILTTLWNVVSFVWALIGGAITTAWNTVIKPVWDAMIGFIDNTLLPKFTIVKDWILGIWDAIANGIGAVWETIKSMVISGVNAVIGFINILIDGVNGITGLINKVAPGDDIGKISHINKIGQASGGDSVWGRGLGKGRGVLAPGSNPYTGTAGKGVLALARGGIPPANVRDTGPFLTNGVRAIVGEGRPQYPEFVIPTDPRFRDRSQELWHSAGTQLFAKGGVLPRGPGVAGLYDPLASKVARILQEAGGRVTVVSGWRDSAKQAQLYRDYMNGVPGQAKAAPPGSSNHERGAAVDFGGDLRTWQTLAAKYGLIFPVRGENWHAEDPSQTGRGGLLGAAVQQIYSNLAGTMAPIVWNVRSGLNAMDAKGPITGMGHVVASGILSAMERIDTYANAQYSQAGFAQAAGMTAGFGGGGAERWRQVALQALGMAGAPSGWIGSLLRRMNQESGGNPFATNNWDSNARKGTPSKGLMQTIQPTFDAYAGELRGRGIFDPLANIFAAIRYTIARYGSGPAGWDKRGGYSAGAWKTGGTSFGPLHTDELVMPATAADRFRNLLQSGTVSGGGTTIHIDQIVIQAASNDAEARRARDHQG